MLCQNSLGVYASESINVVEQQEVVGTLLENGEGKNEIEISEENEIEKNIPAEYEEKQDEIEIAGEEEKETSVENKEEKDEIEITEESEEKKEQVEESVNTETEKRLETLVEDKEKGEQLNLFAIIDEQQEEAVIENEDPQYGRENGYLDEGFIGIESFSNEDGYIHAEKYVEYEPIDVIDVSAYQKDIDWVKVKQSGIDYAFIRAGFRGYGETGSLNTDQYFEKNIQKAIAAGIEVGVYFFSQSITEEEAVKEAEYVITLIDNYEVTLPVVIDFEYASTSKGLTGRLYNAKLSKESATKICKQFCATVETFGYEGMVYANKDMLENGLNADEISEDYKIWLANYGNTTIYEGKYDFWQYTDSGVVSGIEGNVDKSFWYRKRNNTYVEVQEGVYTISTCLDTTKVFDIPSASDKSGLPVQLYSNNNSWAQKFYVRPETENTYVIMSGTTGKVLEVDTGKVIQNAYSGEKTQQWKFLKNDDNSLCIESVSESIVIEVTGGKAVNKASLMVGKNKQAKTQKFYMNPVNDDEICSVKDGYYIVETALLKDKVLNIQNDGNGIELSTVKVLDAQKFKFEYIGAGCYQISSALNQKTLLSGSEKQLLLGTESGSNFAEKWIIRKYSTGLCNIISAKDGKKIDIASAKTEDGSRVQKYEGNGHNAQNFRLYETVLGDEKLEEGIYVIHSALDDTKVIDLSGGSKKCDANIQLYSENGKTPQKFVIEYTDDGMYSIISYHSGMAVAVKDNKNLNKTNVLQFFPTGEITQKWKIVPTGKGYYNIVSCAGGKLLDVAGGNTANKTNIQIYQANGKSPQKFRFEKVGEVEEFVKDEREVENGTYVIASSLNEKMMVDLSGGSLYAGANIQLYSSNNCSAQQFVICKTQGSEFYTITSKKSGMQVVYANSKLKNSTNVCQDTPDYLEGNKWSIQHVIGDYYRIYAADSNFCLDVSGAKTINRTNIQIYQSNGHKAQIFKLQQINNQVTTEQNATQELKEGLYTIATAVNNSKMLDVPSGLSTEGLNLQIYQNNNATAQKFIVKKLENGNYTVAALCSGKLLTVEGSTVVQKTDNRTNSQQWKAIYVGNGYYSLKSVQNGKMLDVKGGKSANGTKIQTYTSNNLAPQRFKFIATSTSPTSKFTSDGNDGYTVNYEVYTKGNETSSDKKYYLMQADCYSGSIYGSPLTAVPQNYEVSISLSGLEKSKLKELAMDKLVLAVKLSDGSYKAVNDPVSISNPEAIAQNTSAIFKASSKKGLQGVAYASNGSMPVDARYANTKQTLLNLDIADVVNPKSNYTNFTYKGKTYKFSNCSDLVANVKSMNAGYEQYLYGNNGNTKVAVSLCLLLSYDSANNFLIDPAARSSGHRYYTLNVREEKSRETLEALFVYLGELFGQEDCYVTNWILGNEINSSKAWNYQGSLSFDNYMTCYTTAFQMLYNAVKSEKTGNTVSISLDNGWTAAPDTYAGKTVLDSFAKKINALNPNIEWSISYHPYSYPLTRADFWNDSSNTTNSTSAKYISMKNITVLTNYAASLESKYKMNTGSIRVLLTEQGYSYGAGADKQATAIARGYYIAEFNDRIDAFIIRAIVDDAEEAKGKLYFGLMNSQQEKRAAFYVYEFMDSDLSKLKNTSASSVVSSANYGKFNSAKNILCNTNWKSIVPGFNATKLAGIK